MSALRAAGLVLAFYAAVACVALIASGLGLDILQ